MRTPYAAIDRIVKYVEERDQEDAEEWIADAGSVREWLDTHKVEIAVDEYAERMAG